LKLADLFVISHSARWRHIVRTRLTQVAMVVLTLFSVHAPVIQSAEVPWAEKATYIPKLEKNLKENIMAFWLSKSLDRVNGGYTINFGPKGEPKGPGTKMIVTQARVTKRVPLPIRH